jgi:hypothetical protein
MTNFLGNKRITTFGNSQLSGGAGYYKLRNRAAASVFDY